MSRRLSVKNAAVLLRYNVGISMGLHTLAALVLVLCTPVFFSLVRLSSIEMATVGELYLSISGILLFVPVAGLDERENIHEIVRVRITPHGFIFALRLIIAGMAAFLLTAGVIVPARLNGGAFPCFTLMMGTLISSLFLGILGMTFSLWTGEPSAGYLVSFSYFVFEWFTKGRYTGDFYLFSLLNGSMDEKYRILAVLLIMVAADLIHTTRRS